MWGGRRTFCTRYRRTRRRGRGEGRRQKEEGIHDRGTEGTEAGREDGRNEAGSLTEISPKASPAIHAFTSLFAYSHCYARSICSPTRTGNKADGGSVRRLG